jgi:hypothetical protein
MLRYVYNLTRVSESILQRKRRFFLMIATNDLTLSVSYIFRIAGIDLQNLTFTAVYSFFHNSAVMASKVEYNISIQHRKSYFQTGFLSLI